MARVLILDPSTTHAAEMARALRLIRCQSVIRKTANEALEELAREEIDAIVIGANQAADWRSAVETISPFVHELPNRPPIICILHGPYRGPADRLWGTRRGVKVVYERY